MKRIVWVFLLVLLSAAPTAAWAQCRQLNVSDVEKFTGVSLAGDAFINQADYDAAERHYRQNAETEPKGSVKRIVALKRLSTLFVGQRRLDEAQQAAVQAHNELAAHFDEKHPYGAEISETLVAVLFFSGKKKEAAQLHRLALDTFGGKAQAWSKDSGGSATHDLSGGRIPDAVGILKRTKTETLRTDCTDVSATYRSQGMLMSLYITKYRQPATNEQIFQGSRDLALKRLNNAVLLGEGSVDQVKDTMPNNGRVAVIQFGAGDAGRNAHSLVYVFQSGDWSVKARFTYAITLEAQAEAAVADLWTKMHWPDK